MKKVLGVIAIVGLGLASCNTATDAAAKVDSTVKAIDTTVKAIDSTVKAVDSTVKAH